MTFNQTLSTQTHANAKYAFIRNIVVLYRQVYDDECKIIVHTYMVLRLDYCNDLLCGLSSKTTKFYNEFKTIQIVWYENMTPVLHDLHGLPVVLTVHFKALLYIYKGWNNSAARACLLLTNQNKSIWWSLLLRHWGTICTVLFWKR